MTTQIKRELLFLYLVNMYFVLKIFNRGVGVKGGGTPPGNRETFFEKCTWKFIVYIPSSSRVLLVYGIVISMDTAFYSQLTTIQTALKVAMQQVDELLTRVITEDDDLREGLNEAILAAALEHHGSTAYYMYVRMQRKLSEQGYGHVKRAVIYGALLHAGWRRKRIPEGIVWFPPTQDEETTNTIVAATA